MAGLNVNIYVNNNLWKGMDVQDIPNTQEPVQDNNLIQFKHYRPASSYS